MLPGAIALRIPRDAQSGLGGAVIRQSTILPGAARFVALVDRFTEPCHVLDIDADSWRQEKNW